MQISHVASEDKWDRGSPLWFWHSIYVCFWNVAVRLIPLTIDKYVRRMMFGDTNEVSSGSSTYCDPLRQLLPDSAIHRIGARWLPWETKARPWARATVGSCRFGVRPIPYGTLDRPRAFMTDERSIWSMKLIGSSEVDEEVSRLERWADYID